MTFEEFKNTVVYTRNKVMIPFFNRPRFDKVDFMRHGKYKKDLEEKALRRWYDTNKDRFY